MEDIEKGQMRPRWLSRDGRRVVGMKNERQKVKMGGEEAVRS
jgi:hypothetical protein